jgi:DNA-binding CsgD family transcriptional regulator
MVAWGEMATGRGLRREMICTVLQDWASADDTGRAALLDVHPYVLCGDALLFGDDVDGARRMYEAARREAEAIGSESLVAVALDFLYDAEILAGDWERAAGYVDEAERLMTANEDATAISRGDILAHLGRVDEARRILSDQTQRMESAGFLEIARYCRFSLGSLELSVGDLPEAHRHLSRATQLLMDSGSLEPGMGRFLPDAIETLVGLGDLAEAERLTDWLEERGRALNRVSALATGARCRGLLLSAKGDHGGALEHLERAMVEHERLPMPFERARTLLVLGAVRRRADHKRAAREALDEALEVFEHLGAVLWADKARAELASIGGRAVAIGELTPMESRVAHLAAAGRTNREIAETLFLSIRTVESHLSHAYHKLGVRSRTELALVLEDLAVT